MDVDTTSGVWPGHSSSSAEPRQALGASVWEWGGSLRAIVWEVLLSVLAIQDSCTPQKSCCAVKVTHSVSSKPLRLNRREEGLQGHFLCPALWGLRPS